MGARAHASATMQRGMGAQPALAIRCRNVEADRPILWATNWSMGPTMEPEPPAKRSRAVNSSMRSRRHALESRRDSMPMSRVATTSSLSVKAPGLPVYPAARSSKQRQNVALRSSSGTWVRRHTRCYLKRPGSHSCRHIQYTARSVQQASSLTRRCHRHGHTMATAMVTRSLTASLRVSGGRCAP